MPREEVAAELLKLTAELGVSAVAGRLSELVGAAVPPWRTESLREFLCPSLVVTQVEAVVDLTVYDALLAGEVVDVA